MGRVARYKKIKSFDPYSKQNGGRVELDKVGVWGLGDSGRKPKKRSKTSERLRALRKKRKTSKNDSAGDGFDLPPEGDDFDLSDLVGSLKKQTPVQNDEGTTKIPSSSLPVTTKASLETIQKLSASHTASSAAKTSVDEDEEVKAAKLLGLEKQLSKSQAEVAATKMAGRMEGESKRAYNRRVKLETRQIIRNEKQGSQNLEKKQRKKNFLNNKKKRKRGKTGYQNSSDVYASDDDNDGMENNDGLVTAEQAIAARARETAVRFGEQAERPPSFRQVPRGASQRKRDANKKDRSLASDSEIRREQLAMELVRRKTLAQYAAMKNRRKQQGDFHL